METTQPKQFLPGDEELEHLAPIDNDEAVQDDEPLEVEQEPIDLGEEFDL